MNVIGLFLDHEIPRGMSMGDTIAAIREQGTQVTLVTSGAVGAAMGVSAAQAQIQIATAGPMTGQYASFGQQMKAGAEQAVEDERQALLLMLDQIGQDQPLSRVAEELNRQGFRTRAGARWGVEAVFQMLSRLIELAPAILGSHAWEARRVAGRP